jgi:hypothetical protein
LIGIQLPEKYKENFDVSSKAKVSTLEGHFTPKKRTGFSDF